MNKILVVDDEEGFRDIVLMVLETHFDYPVLEAESGNSAIEILKSDSEIGLILCDYRMANGTGGDVFQYVKDHAKHIPYILISTSHPDEFEVYNDYKEVNPKNSQLEKPFSSEALFNCVKNSYVKNHQLVEEEDEVIIDGEQNYFKVRADRLLKYLGTFPVFIQLSKDKYVKIRDNGDESREPIEKYISKGVEYVYLQGDDYKSFFDKFMDVISNQLNQDDLSVAESNELQLSSIEQIHEYLKALGVKEKTLGTVNQMVDATVSQFKKGKKFADILKALEGMEGYVYKHSHLTSYVACAIAEKMNWKTSSIWEKLVLASLFQDLEIQDSEIAKVYSIEDDFFRCLKLDERTNVKKHMVMAVELLDKVPEITAEVRNCILNHHEKPDGSGFPRGMDSKQVSPLEALFIMSVHFSHEMIVRGLEAPDQVSKLVENYKENYSKGNYKQAYDALVKVFT